MDEFWDMRFKIQMFIKYNTDIAGEGYEFCQDWDGLLKYRFSCILLFPQNEKMK